MALDSVRVRVGDEIEAVYWKTGTRPRCELGVSLLRSVISRVMAAGTLGDG